MKKMKLFPYAAFTAVVLLAAVAGHAQESNLQMKIGYNVASPLGSFKSDVAGNTSFRGFNAELAYPVSNRFQIGLNVLYNDFYEKFPRQTYKTDQGTLSAVITNSVQTLPLLAKVNYNLITHGMVQPYVGAGAGVNFITYKQYLGEFPSGKNAFKPALSGDLGVNIPFTRLQHAGVNAGASYNYMPFSYNGISNFNNWGVHAGVFFTLH